MWRLAAAIWVSAATVGLAQVVPGGSEVAPGAGEDDQEVAELGEIGAVEEPALSFWQGWGHSVALGLNGSEGNTENLSIRASMKGERKTEFLATGYELIYGRASESSEVTQNRFEARGRNDWLFPRSPRWRYFLTATYEYDDFQEWQHRVTFGNGLGYAFIKEEDTLLLGRAGIGVVREFGSEDNRWRPEGILGIDLEHKLTERQKLTATAELFPELLDFGPYRARAAATWEILLDESMNLNLRLGVEDRYDSTPGAGRTRNDFTYFAMLGFTF